MRLDGVYEYCRPAWEEAKRQTDGAASPHYNTTTYSRDYLPVEYGYRLPPVGLWWIQYSALHRITKSWYFQLTDTII
jgi:hypothetical protein